MHCPITKDRIEYQLADLLDACDLPDDTIERARRFIESGNLGCLLYELPLALDELMAAGEVVACASSLATSFAAQGASSAASSTTVPTLPEAVRHRLQALTGEDDERTDAALYVLVQNLKAHAFNRIFSNRKRFPHRYSSPVNATTSPVSTEAPA